MENLKIGLCGTGNVGLAFAKSILNSEILIKQNYGLNISISLIGARKGKVEGLEGIPIVKNILDVTKSNDVDVVVELIGGIDDAYALAKATLKNKKHFITANKALIAAHSKELFELANQNNVHIGFEASVAGGIPIIRTIRDGLISNRINSFAGILNGTSNFIFSKMSDDGLAFDKALLLAQKEGFAEPDPTFDISGQDAAQKTSILATLSFFQHAVMENVYFEGIDKITPQDIDFGDQLDFVLKPLSVGILEKNGITLGSFPAFVKKDSLLASIHNENNAVLEQIQMWKRQAEALEKDGKTKEADALWEKYYDAMKVVEKFNAENAKRKEDFEQRKVDYLSEIDALESELKQQLQKHGSGSSVLLESSNLTTSTRKTMHVEFLHQPGRQFTMVNFG